MPLCPDERREHVPDRSFGGDSLADVERERQRAWDGSEPFSDGGEIENAGCAAIYGDKEAAWRLRSSAESRVLLGRALNEAHLRRLSADDLRAMREWDMTHYLDDCASTCELFECEDWHEDNGKHEDACPWSKHCGHELEVHGLPLHRGDPT